MNALTPRPAGRPTQTPTLTVDKTLVDRFIIAFPMLPETVRGIRLGLRLLLGVTRPVGYISQTLTAAGAQAETENGSLYVPLPILGEADEIFQGRQPCLTVVDGRSFLVVYLVPDESRDGTTWEVTYIEPGRGCGHPPGAAGCRESDLGHPGSVPPFLQSGGIVAQLAAPVPADSPGDVPVVAALVATVLESSPV